MNKKIVITVILLYMLELFFILLIKFQAQQLFVLFEHASGYGLFRVREFEEVGTFLPEVEASVADVSKFMQVVKLVGYRPFTSAASALENINAISEGMSYYIYFNNYTYLKSLHWSKCICTLNLILCCKLV